MSNKNSSIINQILFICCIVLFIGIAIAAYRGFNQIEDLKYRIMKVEMVAKNSLSNHQDGIPNMSESDFRAKIYSAAHEASESFVNHTGNLLEVFGVMLTVISAIICIFIPLKINEDQKKWMEQRLETSEQEIEEQKKQIETMQIRRKEQMNKYNDLLKATNLFTDRMKQRSIKTTRDISKRLIYQDDYNEFKNTTKEPDKIKKIEEMIIKDIADSKLYYELGILHSNDPKTYTNACEDFKKAIDIDIEFVDAYSKWADVLKNMGNNEPDGLKKQKYLQGSWEKLEKAINLTKVDSAREGLQQIQKTIEEQISSSRPQKEKTFSIKDVYFKMIPVKGGSFTMGMDPNLIDYDSPIDYPKHKVWLDDYYIGETVVTQQLWCAIMGSNPSNNPGKNLPVENVSWDDANRFIEILNSNSDIQNQGITFYLPTSAQWEYAAHSGCKQDNYLYAGSNNIDNVAWYEKNSDKKTHPVMRKTPNQLGLYDMSGNVFEWCKDFWKGYTYYEDETWVNPVCVQNYGLGRICRGGGWGSSEKSCRVTSVVNGHASSAIGFRLVCTLTPPAPQTPQTPPTPPAPQTP